MAKRKYFLVLDVEGAGSTDCAFVYDIGGAIVDKTVIFLSRCCDNQRVFYRQRDDRGQGPDTIETETAIKIKEW